MKSKIGKYSNSNVGKYNRHPFEVVSELIKNYIYYFNKERPSYFLNYKTQIQFKLELGFQCVS